MRATDASPQPPLVYFFTQVECLRFPLLLTTKLAAPKPDTAVVQAGEEFRDQLYYIRHLVQSRVLTRVADKSADSVWSGLVGSGPVRVVEFGTKTCKRLIR